VNVEGQIAYWATGAERALPAARSLAANGFATEALFWAHLAVEKALKAQVVRSTRSDAPFTHDLRRLARLGKIELSISQTSLLAKLTVHQQIARYPTDDQADLEVENCEALLGETEEMVRWLLAKL
jgi:HEPN domain-containing protein